MLFGVTCHVNADTDTIEDGPTSLLVDSPDMPRHVCTVSLSASGPRYRRARGRSIQKCPVDDEDADILHVK